MISPVRLWSLTVIRDTFAPKFRHLLIVFGWSTAGFSLQLRLVPGTFPQAFRRIPRDAVSVRSSHLRSQLSGVVRLRRNTHLWAFRTSIQTTQTFRKWGRTFATRMHYSALMNPIRCLEPNFSLMIGASYSMFLLHRLYRHAVAIGAVTSIQKGVGSRFALRLVWHTVAMNRCLRTVGIKPSYINTLNTWLFCYIWDGIGC